MATITEDYVSFEIANLLKEKGFDEKVSTHYLVHPSGFSEFFDKKDEFPEPEDVWLKCPTLQVAMKWLREVHHIYLNINIRVILEQWAGYDISVYTTDNDGFLSKNIPIKLKDNVSYEEAIEAALKYCLKNLI